MTNKSEVTIWDKMHAIAKALDKTSASDVTVEGGGAATPFIQFSHPDHPYLFVLGDEAETWGGQVYQSAEAMAEGVYLEDTFIETDIPTTTDFSTEDVPAYAARIAAAIRVQMPQLLRYAEFEVKLTATREAQDTFWKLANELELLAGRDIDCTLDLRDYTVQDLLDAKEEEEVEDGLCECGRPKSQCAWHIDQANGHRDITSAD